MTVSNDRGGRRRPGLVGADEPRPVVRPAILPIRASHAAVVVGLWWALTIIGVLWFAVDTSAIFFLAGSFSCLIVSSPLVLRRQYDLLSPWTLVVLGAYIGYGLRGLFISLGINGTRTLDQLYLLGRGPDFYVRPSAVFLLALCLLTIGYIWGAREVRVSTTTKPAGSGLLARTELDPVRVRILVIGCAVVGFVAFVLYAQRTGGLSLSSISAKRTTINGVNLDTTTYQSHGQLRVLNTLSTVAFWLQLAWYCHRRLRHGFPSLRAMWLLVLFLNACLLSVYASTRIDIIAIILGALVVQYCLRGETVSRRTLVVAITVAVLAPTMLTALRTLDQGTSEAAAITSETFVDTFVLTRTFSDIPTTANIIHVIPQQLPYADGETITAWIAAPIPRALWPDKPLISLGPVIGSVVFGNLRSGVPPGLVAEAYWNFGLGGLLILPVLAGIALGRLERWLTPTARSSPTTAILMGAISIRFGFDLMSNAIGYAIFHAVQMAVLVVPVLWIATTRHSRPATDARRRHSDAPLWVHDERRG